MLVSRVLSQSSPIFYFERVLPGDFMRVGGWKTLAVCFVLFIIGRSFPTYRIWCGPVPLPENNIEIFALNISSLGR